VKIILEIHFNCLSLFFPVEIKELENESNKHGNRKKVRRSKGKSEVQNKRSREKYKNGQSTRGKSSGKKTKEK
jgi:hypothetical protein